MNESTPGRTDEPPRAQRTARLVGSRALRGGVLALAIVGGSALGETIYITIPGEGWHLILDTPAITSSESANKNGRFSFTGADINTGVTFSVHTEPASGGSNKQCRDEYWAKTERNPFIVKGSVESFETSLLIGVSYRSEGEYQGRRFTTVNAHGYFVRNGKCVDLHVSQIPYSADGKTRVERIVRTARAAQ